LGPLEALLSNPRHHFLVGSRLRERSQRGQDNQNEDYGQ
jgi:hypothetical protein